MFVKDQVKNFVYNKNFVIEIIIERFVNGKMVSYIDFIVKYGNFVLVEVQVVVEIYNGLLMFVI